MDAEVREAMRALQIALRDDWGRFQALQAELEKVRPVTQSMLDAAMEARDEVRVQELFQRRDARAQIIGEMDEILARANDKAAIHRAAAQHGRARPESGTTEALRGASEKIIGKETNQFQGPNSKYANRLHIKTEGSEVRASVVDKNGRVISEVKFDPNEATSVKKAATKLAKSGIKALSDPTKAAHILRGALMTLFVADALHALSTIRDPKTPLKMIREFVDLVGRKHGDMTADFANWAKRWQDVLGGPFGKLCGYQVYLQSILMGAEINDALDKLDPQIRQEMYQRMLRSIGELEKGLKTAALPKEAGESAEELAKLADEKEAAAEVSSETAIRVAADASSRSSSSTGSGIAGSLKNLFG